MGIVPGTVPGVVREPILGAIWLATWRQVGEAKSAVTSRVSWTGTGGPTWIVSCWLMCETNVRVIATMTCGEIRAGTCEGTSTAIWTVSRAYLRVRSDPSRPTTTRSTPRPGIDTAKSLRAHSYGGEATRAAPVGEIPRFVRLTRNDRAQRVERDAEGGKGAESASVGTHLCVLVSSW